MEIRNFRKIDKATIAAKFDIYFPTLSITIRDLTLVKTEGKDPWIAFPNRPFQTELGEKKYFSYVLVDEQKRVSFQAKAMELLAPFLTPSIEEMAEEFNQACPW